MREATTIEAVNEALVKPEKIAERRMADGDVRRTYRGGKANVTVGVRDHRLIQANPRGRQKMIIEEKDKNFLLKNLDKAAALIEADDIEGLLDVIDGFMTEKGYGPKNFEELNELGREAEQILDRIYYYNN